MFEHSEQAITHIRGCRRDSNQYTPYKGKTWQHDTRMPRGHHEWPQFTTRSKSHVGSYLTLVPSSMRMPQWTHRGWSDTIPYNIHEVGYRPTRRHIKLLDLRIPYVPYASVHSSACSSGLAFTLERMTVSFSWTSRMLTPKAPTWPFLLDIVDNPNVEWNTWFKQLTPKEP
jgi:hypothetical protein